MCDYSIVKRPSIVFIFVFSFVTVKSVYGAQELSKYEIELLNPHATKFNRFMDTLAYEDFLKLDASTRSIPWATLLTYSIDPDSGLTPQQRVSVKNIISTHFDPLPESRRLSIVSEAFLFAMINGRQKNAEQLTSKFLPKYPQEKIEFICDLVRKSNDSVVKFRPETPIESFTKTSAETNNILRGIFAYGPKISDANCPTQDGVLQPLNLVELIATIDKKFPTATKVENRSTTSSYHRPKKECNLSGLRATLQDSVNAIAEHGKQVRAYFGDDSMTCEFHGLITREASGDYTLYSYSFRPDRPNAISFKSVDELIKNLVIRDKSGLTAQPTVLPTAPRKIERAEGRR